MPIPRPPGDARLASVLHAGDLFLDVGANVGSYTIWAGERGADVIALEPAPDTYALLLENIELNGYGAEAIQAAAGVTCGTARFTSGLDCVNRLDPGEVPRPGWSRLIPCSGIACGRDEGGRRGLRDRGAPRLPSGTVRAPYPADSARMEHGLSSRRSGQTAAVADLLASYGYRLYRPDQ